MSKDLIVIGLGSSAGGLEALQIMLKNLPDLNNCAYIIAQHLSPTHKSMMVELLARNTNLPVIEVKNGMVIKRKTIYMTPENTDIFVKDGKMYLKNVEQSFGPKPSVNYFFSSLATAFEERAIGIILSGTGSDGSYGIRAIKAEGGISIAQAPNSAKYDGMPLSAINTGKVDLVVPIDTLSKEIERIVHTIDNNEGLSLNERTLQQIYRTLFDEHGVDFSLYKKNTIVRRIERRLAALKVDNLQKYLEIIQNSTEEVNNLYHDILIGVTSFFRDKESFDKLKPYIESIVEKKEQGEEVRFWSIGCSTGEEAYSVAILLSEILKEKISKYKIKIFATDIDDESLKIARTGVYAETSLEGLDKDIIQRYFSVQKNQFEIKKSIRELVVFSKHNVIADSPFLRIDMLSCRNMLIYFNQNLQNRFFSIAHYALRDNGLLFLGKSESVGQNIDLFNIIEKNSKIFKAQFTGVKEAPKLFNYGTSYKSYEEPKVQKYKNEEELLEDKITHAVHEIIMNQCIVINSSNDIIYIKGEIPYLKFSQGRVSNNIFKLLGDEISLDVRSAINESNKHQKVQMTPFKSINVFEDIVRYMRVTVIPVQNENNDDWMNILFFQTEDAQNIKGSIVTHGNESEIIEKLQLELNSTKSHLQNVIEELETSYEEMQSLNEELQSSNEELQSSNEELETTNEELQSTNEELQTAYSELRVLYEDKEKRATQLEELTEKLNLKSEDYRKQKELTEGIIDSATIAITMLNANGEVTFANKQAELLFGISKKEILDRTYNDKNWEIENFDGQPMRDEDLPFSIIQRTYEPVKDIKHVVKTEHSKLYLSISGAPLFDVDGQFKGAVFCIDDLTHNELMKNDLRSLKNSSNTPLVNSDDYVVERYKVLEMSMVNLSSTMRNMINDISILTQVDSEEFEKNKLQVSNIIQNFNEKFGTSFIDYYLDKYRYQKAPFESELESGLKIFETIFENTLISTTIDIQTVVPTKVSIEKFRRTLYNIFEFILVLQVEQFEEKPSKLMISDTKVDSKAYLNFKLTPINIDTKDKALITRLYEKSLLNYMQEIEQKSELFINDCVELSIEIR